MSNEAPSRRTDCSPASPLIHAAPPHLVAYDITTFVEFVKYHGPAIEIRAYVDAFTLVALVEGVETIRIALRPSEAIKIVRGRSDQPLTPNRLAGAMRAVESWEGAEPGAAILRFSHEDGLRSFVRVWTSDEWTVARVRSFDGGSSFEAVAIDVVGEDEHVERADLPGREVARVRFFDVRQYQGHSQLNVAFSYEARDGRLKTTYRLPHFREQREEAFAEVVEYVAGETGVKPLMLLSDRIAERSVDRAATPEKDDHAEIDFALMQEGEELTVFEDGPIYLSGNQATERGWSSYALRVVVARRESTFVAEIQESGDNDPRTWKTTDLGESAGGCDRTYRQEAFPEGVLAVATYYQDRARKECAELRQHSAEEAAEYGITEKALRDQWKATAVRLSAEEACGKVAA